MDEESRLQMKSECGSKGLARAFHAGLAQVVERQFRTLEVGGSKPSSGSIFGTLVQLAERLAHNRRVTGSIPVRPTNRFFF